MSFRQKIDLHGVSHCCREEQQPTKQNLKLVNPENYTSLIVGDDEKL
jgi:hypothetical protein